jgi:hypothetical protein
MVSSKGNKKQETRKRKQKQNKKQNRQMRGEQEKGKEKNGKHAADSVTNVFRHPLPVEDTLSPEKNPSPRTLPQRACWKSSLPISKRL